MCIPLLLFGGSIFPPFIGIIAGALGTRINKPLNPEGSRLSGGLLRFLAVLWPWSLALYVLWVFGQWVIGYFFNDWLLANGYLIIVMVLGTLLLTVVTTYARDLHEAAKRPPRSKPSVPALVLPAWTGDLYDRYLQRTAPAREDGTRGDTGEGATILSPHRVVPPDGVLIQSP